MIFLIIVKLKLSLCFKDNCRRCQLEPQGPALFPGRAWKVSGKFSEQEKTKAVLKTREVWGQARSRNLNFHVPGSRDQGPHRGQPAPSAAASLSRGTPSRGGLDLGLIRTLTLGVKEPRQVQQCRGVWRRQSEGCSRERCGGDKQLKQEGRAPHCSPGQVGARAALCPPLEQGS